MYLKTLEIHGFKSFADKTVLEFAEGVTGIVGPNGCGKSNVVDAIRWVLGETSAKALRGGEMADVIFNGTEKRKPLGMAEVTLTMADCEKALNVDYNEVAITRRVFRDGKSEYRINNTLCRLKDINDMLMDTGIGRTAYSIMAQGQIDQILSSKPEERRAVFEEAAGITKFKREKREALRKLEYTEANLLRVSDVLVEQERRMNSLKRQVAKARRYQTLAKDAQVLDSHLAHRKFVDLNAQKDEFSTSIHGLEARGTELERQLPIKEADVDKARATARSFEGALAELRHGANEHRTAINTAEGRIAFNEERRTELESRIKQNREDIEATKQKLQQQQFDFNSASESLDQLTKVIIEKEQKLSSADESAKTTRQERQKLDAQLRESRAEASRTLTAIAALQAKIESSIAQLEGNRERTKQLGDDEKRLILEHQEIESERARIAEEVEDAGGELNQLEDKFKEIERSYQKTRGDLDAARETAAEAGKLYTKRSARLQAVSQLIESGEGFEKGTRHVLNGLDDPTEFKPSVKGALASLIETDNDCARAIEAALGTHLQAVLVQDHGFAETVIQRLTDKQLGTAAVIPEDFVSHSRETQVETLPENATAWALDRVKSDKRVAGVIEHLLEKVLIVPDLKAALGLRADLPGVTFACLDGSILGAEGMIRGGASKDGATSVLELQNEARELEFEVEKLKADDQSSAAKVTKLEAKLEKLQNEVEVSREGLQRQNVQLSTLQGELSLATREVENLDTKIENVRWERGELEKREKSASDSRSRMEDELSKARNQIEEIEAANTRLTSQTEAAARKEQDQMEILQELRTDLAVDRRAKQSAESQQKPMEARLSELQELSMRRESEISSFTQRILSATEENGNLKAEVEQHQSNLSELDKEIEERSKGRHEILEKIEAAESELAKVRREHAKLIEQKGKEEVASTKLELRIENLCTSIQERYQVELIHFEPDSHALLVAIESQKKAQSRRGKQVVIQDQIENSSSDSTDESEELEEDIPTIIVDKTVEEEGDENALPGEVEGEPDWDFIEGIVSDLKRRIDSMGPVNMDAIEEFEELEERHQFLRNQHDDLTNSKSELLEVIERINTETMRLFSETFDQVRVNFKTMFKELFGEKGQADLSLIDEDDPLESGIEVIAKPPGKKLQSISLLSGGERSMTAVALLFSIYMIKPSPFAVLDELDAPLDEANIGRFVRVLDRFIDRSQFIIVTHSKRTMNRADVMYGVTMEEFGVSKPVGMRLTEAEGAKKHAKTETLNLGG